MITITGLSKFYGKQQVLKNVNLHLSTGVYAILAPNGAGKTTLMKIIATLFPPDEGIVTYNSVSIFELNDKYRELIGYLPQDFEPYSNISAELYLRYIAECKGLLRHELNERIPKLLRLVNLDGTGKKAIGKFSGGMKKRLGIAQALLNNPKILILDEPTAGLDPKESLVFRDYISHIAKDKTILLSTHIISDVERIADSIIFLKEGSVLYKDTQENLCNLLRGKVYQAICSSSDLPEGAVIISQKQEKEYTKIRFVYHSANACHFKMDLCEPTLEDLYIYIFRNDFALSQAEYDVLE